MKKILSLTTVLCAVAACAPVYPEDYPNPGDPETLLDMSSEQVNIGLDSPNALVDLTSVINEDMPSRAELDCKLSEIRCAQAKEILDNREIPADIVGEGDRIMLVYERVIARDCDNSFVEDQDPRHNRNYPSFGCSMKANTIQMVTDRNQFTNPSLVDLPDAEKAVQVYNGYLKAPEGFSDSSSSLETLLSDVGGSGGGTGR